MWPSSTVTIQYDNTRLWKIHCETLEHFLGAKILHLSVFIKSFAYLECFYHFGCLLIFAQKKNVLEKFVYEYHQGVNRLDPNLTQHSVRPDLLTNCIFILFDSLCPSQLSFSHVRMGLPRLNQY